MGRARTPFYPVVNFEDGYAGDGVTGNAPGLEYTIPKGGAKFDFPIYGIMTNIPGATEIYGQIYRTARTREGQRIAKMFGYPQRLFLAAGDENAGAGRVVPAEWFYLPEPSIIRTGEALQMRLVQAGFESAGESGAGAFPPAVFEQIAGYRATFLSERIADENAAEGKLTVEEIEEITIQILTRRQRTFISFVDVDYAVTAKHQGVTLPELDEWAIILGFTSGTPTGGAANYLRYSTVAIENPNGVEWSNDSEPVPVLALCSPMFDANNRQVFYRNLVTPYLVGPRRENLSFTFAQRSDLGEDTTGKIGVVMRTV